MMQKQLFDDESIDYAALIPAPAPVVEHRTCTVCGKRKPLWEFGKNRKRLKSGVKKLVRAQCKRCIADYEQARRNQRKQEADAESEASDATGQGQG